MSPGCHRDVTGMSPGCHRDVTGPIQRLTCNDCNQLTLLTSHGSVIRQRNITEHREDKIMKRIIAIFTAGALLVVAAPVSAADYFADKTITVQVPSGSGGSYHAYCQAVQRNIAKFIPGNPKTVIQNLPGGGGAKAASFMYNVAPKNGTVIGMIAPGNITIPLVRKVKFDARKFEWLGSPAARSNAVWFWHTAGIKSLDDLKKKEVPIATSGFGSSSSVLPRMINQVLGTKMKLIYGYRGGGLMNLAIEKGEVMGRATFHSAFSTARPTWLPEKKVIPVIIMGPYDSHPAYKGVPYLQDLLKPGSLERKMYDIIAINLEVGQAFYVAPGTPKKLVSQLEKAFSMMLAEPSFKKQVLKRGLEYSPVSAADIRKKIEIGFKVATPEVLKELKKIYKKKKS
jgi:tripartite-type tricarboxylate transporter receptor subunit TctC